MTDSSETRTGHWFLPIPEGADRYAGIRYAEDVLDLNAFPMYSWAMRQTYWSIVCTESECTAILMQGNIQHITGDELSDAFLRGFDLNYED